MAAFQKPTESYKVPKQDPPPPPPRPAGPIARGEVLRWARQVEAAARRPQNDPKALPPDLVLTLEQSIRRLLDPIFRSEFSNALYGEQQLGSRRFFASDPNAGRELLRKWGVINVIRPYWNERLKRYFLLAAFPVPIFHWAARDGLSEGDPSIRLMLNRPPLTWHPQYILRCRLCGWAQGVLGGEETFNSPTPRNQLDRLLDDRQPRIRRIHASTVGREVIESFSEEIWGFNSSHFAPDPTRGRFRQPMSGKTADLLDEALEYVATYRSRPAIDPERMFLRRVGPRLRVLRWILRKLRCQVCDRVDCLRFVPGLMLPIDLDLTERAQAEFAYELAHDLIGRCARVRKEGFARGIFWFPGTTPYLRPLQAADRIHSLCEDAREERSKRPVEPRLAAQWLVSRMNNRKRWEALENLILDRSDLPVEEDDLANEQMGPLRAAVLAASHGRRAGQSVGPVWDLLHDERYKWAGHLLLEHYRHKIAAKTPQKRRSKTRRRSQLPR